MRGRTLKLSRSSEARVRIRGGGCSNGGCEIMTETPMSLLSVRVPHGKFKAEERKFGPPLKIAAQDQFHSRSRRRLRGAAETIVENAFLILLVNWQENQWRFFVRLRITVNQQGDSRRRQLSRSPCSKLGSPVFRIDG